MFLHLHDLWRGYNFLAVYLCVCVCMSVCLSVSEQNSSQTDAPIWTRFSQNGCIPLWLGPYWNWWPWTSGQMSWSQWCNIQIFHNSLLTFILCISALLRLIKIKFGKFSPNDCPYLKLAPTFAALILVRRHPSFALACAPGFALACAPRCCATLHHHHHEKKKTLEKKIACAGDRICTQSLQQIWNPTPYPLGHQVWSENGRRLALFFFLAENAFVQHGTTEWVSESASEWVTVEL